jgi:hypothetical protein
MKTPEQMIENIINNFDFEYCHKVMELTNWGWYDHNMQGCIVPSVDQIKRVARRLIEDTMKKISESKTIKSDYPYTIATGGLWASACKNRYGQICKIELRFTLSSWEE